MYVCGVCRGVSVCVCRGVCVMRESQTLHNQITFK